MKQIKNCFQNNHSHLGYCGIAADYGCCTAAHASHIHAGSFPNSAEEKKPQNIRHLEGKRLFDCYLFDNMQNTGNISYETDMI